jgi:hypothetical protein
MGRGEAYTGLRWGNLRERDHMGDPSVEGNIIFRKLNVRVWTGSVWLTIVSGGSHL